MKPTATRPVDEDATRQIQEEERISRLLQTNGFRLKPKRTGYVVVEPLGGRERLRSLDELQQYCRRMIP